VPESHHIKQNLKGILCHVTCSMISQPYKAIETACHRRLSCGWRQHYVHRLAAGVACKTA